MDPRRSFRPSTDASFRLNNSIISHSTRPHSSSSRTQAVQPFARINSRLSLVNSGLPSFLRIDTKDPFEYLRRSSLSSTMSFAPQNRSSPEVTQGFITERTKSDTIDSERGSFVFEEEGDPQEKLLRISKNFLTRGHLLGLKSGKSLSKRVVSSIITIFRIMSNKVAPLKQKTMIFRTTYPSKLLKNNELSASSFSGESPFEYRYLVFPLFVGHWCLLVIDLVRVKAYYYDCVNKHLYIENILAAGFKFLKDELNWHERTNIESTSFRNLTYEKVQETQTWKETDSAVYVLKQVQNLGVKKVRVSAGSTKQYREEFFQLLTHFSEQIN